MCVLAGTLAANTEINFNTTLAVLSLPVFIFNKIIGVDANGLYIPGFKICLSKDGFDNQNEQPVFLVKTNNNVMVQTGGNFSFDSQRYFRLQIDLLIDDSHN